MKVPRLLALFYLALFCLLFLSAAAHPASAAIHAPAEMRGLWVVRDSLTSTASIKHVVAAAAPTTSMPCSSKFAGVAMPTTSPV